MGVAVTQWPAATREPATLPPELSARHPDVAQAGSGTPLPLVTMGSAFGIYQEAGTWANKKMSNIFYLISGNHR